MRKVSFSVAAAMTFAAAAVISAGAAAAAPTGGGNAADTTAQLQAMGYRVQINGSVPVPLSDGVTTGVHGAPATTESRGQPSGDVPFTTVDVDVSCSDGFLPAVLVHA
jgi:hypothetical protein